MFRFADMEKLVTLCGFELRNSTGSHHIYTHKLTGFSVTLPKHAQGVSVGVGKKVIETCVLCARISNVNIGSFDAKLPKEIHDIIIAQHKKCKENIMFLIPEEYRAVKNISEKEDVIKFLKTFKVKQRKDYVFSL